MKNNGQQDCSTRYKKQKMTKLTITRTSEWNNKGREIGVYIDSKKMGTISNGETKDFDIDAGSHQINAKIDWCKSPVIDFQAVENQTTEIKIGGYKYAGLIRIIAVVFALMYVIALYVFNQKLSFLILVVGIGLIYPLYYLTIGKNRFLTIREIE